MIEVGKPFPLKLIHRDGLYFWPSTGGLIAAVHMNRWKPEDLRAFRGRAEIGVLETWPGLPWISLYFHEADLAFDGPVYVGEDPDRRRLIEDLPPGIAIVPLEGDANMVVARPRRATLPLWIYTPILDCRRQTKDEARLKEEVRTIQQLYPDSFAVRALVTRPFRLP